MCYNKFSHKKGGPDESIYLSTEPNHTITSKELSMTESIVTFSQDLAQQFIENPDPFPVDFELAWQWLGYSKKSNAKRMLISQFEKDFDFCSIMSKTPQDGRPSESIFLSVDCFKSLGMMAGTDQGKQIRKYFLECERIAHSKSDNSVIQPSKIEEAKGMASLVDAIFAGVHIDPHLISGIKLNLAKKQLPKIADVLEECVRPTLINNTAQQDELLTPSQIGQKLGISGMAVNKLLIDKGLQVKNDHKTSKKDLAYLPTDMGMEYARVTLATGKSSSDTFQQLRWYSSVLQRVI